MRLRGSQTRVNSLARQVKLCRNQAALAPSAAAGIARPFGLPEPNTRQFDDDAARNFILKVDRRATLCIKLAGPEQATGHFALEDAIDITNTGGWDVLTGDLRRPC
jgi:hypothetical protein